jgi:hypothetical protein
LESLRQYDRTAFLSDLPAGFIYKIGLDNVCANTDAAPIRARHLLARPVPNAKHGA